MSLLISYDKYFGGTSKMTARIKNRYDLNFYVFFNGHMSTGYERFKKKQIGEEIFLFTWIS